MEEQNGFMPHRGTTDGILSLKILSQKRKEHGLLTYVVFLDLVKAFDSVPQDGLYKMLPKMGVPESLRTLIIALHTDFMVKIKSGLEDVETSYTTGVKQGDSRAPILFLLYFKMCIEVLDTSCTAAKPSFVYKMDGVMNGRKANGRRGTQIEFFKSMYADDSAFINTSRWDVDHSLPLIFNTLKEFSLTKHVERGDKRWKTEAVFFPCASDIRHTHTQTLTLSHTHTHTHSHAHVYAHTHAHTHTHTLHQPASHLAPAPTTSLSRKKAKTCISCHSLTALPSGAYSRCQQRRRTLLKPENVAPIHVDGGLVHFTDRFCVSWFHHFK